MTTPLPITSAWLSVNEYHFPRCKSQQTIRCVLKSILGRLDAKWWTRIQSAGWDVYRNELYQIESMHIILKHTFSQSWRSVFMECTCPNGFSLGNDNLTAIRHNCTWNLLTSKRKYSQSTHNRRHKHSSSYRNNCIKWSVNQFCVHKY